jgi:hypothetical protein
MSLKKGRIFAVAALAGLLAAVGVMSIAASASAAVTPITSENCKEPNFLLGPLTLAKPVNGYMTDKKLDQNIPLSGGAFAGTIGLCIEEPGLAINGSITNSTITFPAFTAPIKLLGTTSEVGLEIKQYGPGEGTITKPAGEECTPTTCNSEEEFDDITLNVQAQANIAFTSLKLFGLTVPTQCETSKPVSLPFVKAMTLTELLEGTTITGSTTLPSVSCKGLLGPLESVLLTSLFSGPKNPYSLTFGETTFEE